MIRWRHNNDVDTKQICTRVQNKISYKTGILDFFRFKKLMEWCCFVIYLSNDPHNINGIRYFAPYATVCL